MKIRENFSTWIWWRPLWRHFKDIGSHPRLICCKNKQTKHAYKVVWPNFLERLIWQPPQSLFNFNFSQECPWYIHWTEWRLTRKQIKVAVGWKTGEGGFNPECWIPNLGSNFNPSWGFLVNKHEITEEVAANQLQFTRSATHFSDVHNSS